MKKIVTQEELNERSRISKMKSDLIQVTLPKGTKERILELTNKRPSTFCNEVIMKAIEELEKQKE